MEKNSKVKAGYAKSETFRMATDKEELVKKNDKAFFKRTNSFTLLSDKLANDSFYLRNQPIPNAKAHFPVEWKLQYVDIFYPYAKLDDGQVAPLYIDQPGSSFEVAVCKRKKEFMNKNGLRYTYLERGFGEQEAREILENITPVEIKK